MMNNSVMKFKDFVFPSNPTVINVCAAKKIAQKSVFGKRDVVEEICTSPTKITGKGVFYGDAARQDCVYLARLLKRNSPGWLFCPDSNPIEAYFTSFEYTLDSKKGCASYSFEFVEACNETREQLELTHIIAKGGDNAFTIANEYGVSPTDIMRLNEYRTAFDISEGERVKIR